MANSTLHKMPLYMQGDTSYCVPYSLLGIAHYFGIKISKKEMVRLCGSHKAEGTIIQEAKKNVERIGLKMKRIKFNIKQVRKSLEKGNPVVISHSYDQHNTHFTTIIDVYVDKNKGAFYTLNDTAWGRYSIPAEILKFLMSLDDSWARTVEKI